MVTMYKNNLHVERRYCIMDIKDSPFPGKPYEPATRLPFIQTVLNLAFFHRSNECEGLTAVTVKNSLLGCDTTYSKILSIWHPHDQDRC